MAIPDSLRTSIGHFCFSLSKSMPVEQEACKDPAISLSPILFSPCLPSRIPRCCLRCTHPQPGFLPYKCSRRRSPVFSPCLPLSKAPSSSLDSCGSETCQKIRVSTAFQPGLSLKDHYPHTQRIPTVADGALQTCRPVLLGVLPVPQEAPKRR